MAHIDPGCSNCLFRNTNPDVTPEELCRYWLPEWSAQVYALVTNGDDSPCTEWVAAPIYQQP